MESVEKHWDKIVGQTLSLLLYGGFYASLCVNEEVYVLCNLLMLRYSENQ